MALIEEPWIGLKRDIGLKRYELKRPWIEESRLNIDKRGMD